MNKAGKYKVEQGCSGRRDSEPGGRIPSMNDRAPHDRVSRNKPKSEASAIDIFMVGSQSRLSGEMQTTRLAGKING